MQQLSIPCMASPDRLHSGARKFSWKVNAQIPAAQPEAHLLELLEELKLARGLLVVTGWLLLLLAKKVSPST